MRNGLPGDAFGNRIQIFTPDVDKIQEPAVIAASGIKTYDVTDLAGYNLQVTGEIRRHLLDVNETPIETAWAAAQTFTKDDILLKSGRLYQALADHTAATANEPGVGGSWTGSWALVPYVAVVESEMRGVAPGTFKLVILNAGSGSVTAYLEGM